MVAACGTGPAWAQVDDTLASPACRQALARLQLQEASALAAHTSADKPTAPAPPGPAPAAVHAARQQAAHACLGGRAGAPLPVRRLAQPPLTVAPVAMPQAPVPKAPVPQAAWPAAPAPAPAALPPRIPLNPPPTVVTSCDGSGCWASDGSRLNRAGPTLLGPRGLCTQQGPLLSCP